MVTLKQAIVAVACRPVSVIGRDQIRSLTDLDKAVDTRSAGLGRWNS